MYQDYNNFYEDLSYLLVDGAASNSIKLIPSRPSELLLSTSFYPIPSNHLYLMPYYEYDASSPTSSTHGSSCSSSPSIENMYDTFPFDSIPMPDVLQIATTTTTTTPAVVDKLTLPSTKQRPSKTFKCPICNRLFARKHDLQRHIRVHTGDKPYSCINCNKSFARTDALKRHLRMEDTCRTSPVIQAMKNTGSRRYRNL